MTTRRDIAAARQGQLGKYGYGPPISRTTFPLRRIREGNAARNSLLTNDIKYRGRSTKRVSIGSTEESAVLPNETPFGLWRSYQAGRIAGVDRHLISMQVQIP